MAIDYSLYYRRTINVDRISVEVPEFDVFISAYNSSDRVRRVYDSVRSGRKIWLVHPEYQYADDELPREALVRPGSRDEVAQVNDLLTAIGPLSLGDRVCIDITGFMRHVLMFLVAKLKFIGVREFTAVYSEPSSYLKQEDTEFSTTTTGRVRTVSGLSTSMEYQKDSVIVGVGYDHKLIGEVMNSREGAAIRPLFAFPSLSPDMYQQSAIRASRSGDKAQDADWLHNRKFAPANDPFVTAEVISSMVSVLDVKEATNIYMSPLATKVQALGFVIYWLLQGKSRGSMAVLLPECSSYARETSSGIKRLWAFTVEI